MEEISFRVVDFEIRKTAEEKEYVALKAGLAFSKAFVRFCRDKGVGEFVPYKSKETEEEDED